MVLGILSVMVIMAVAFAISMRTERMASGNYADSVRARQLTQVGLARAMNDLALLLGTNGLDSMTNHVYPAWTVTNSYTADYATPIVDTNKHLLLATSHENQATNFVPRALWTLATNADYRGASNHWLPVEYVVYTNDSAGVRSQSGTNLLGQVKYLILNCSGLLDANFVGGDGVVRGVGTNPNEIAINGMKEFTTGSGADKFIDNRSLAVRYETLEEFFLLNANGSPQVFNEFPSNFTAYSHAPSGYWDTNMMQVMTQVNVGVKDTYLAQRKEFITNAFVQAGFDGSGQAEILFENLLDYTDTGSEPSTNGVLISCVEAVPMINEIVFSSTESGVDVTHEMHVETWCPFVNAPNQSYQFNANINVSDGSVLSYNNESVSVNNMQPYELSTESVTKAKGTFPYTFTIVSMWISQSNGAQVDAVNVPYSINVTASGVNKSLQCSDPRFNWYLANPKYWTVYDGATNLGLINTCTLTNTDYQKDPVMYVANRPLKSVGELGALAYDVWKTVKLYGTDCSRVLDVFAIGENNDVFVTNKVWRGRINPNTRQSNVLAAVFADMSVDEFSEQTSPHKLTADEIVPIVTEIQKHDYTNISDIGRSFDNTAFPPTATNELQKESILRNTCGLLSVRQNLFTVIIEAQVASGGNIPRNPVRQRAVALVWRDPYTGEMFVRSLKWLND